MAMQGGKASPSLKDGLV